MNTSGRSPYATQDPDHHAQALGRLDPEEVHEFYHPFVMVPDLVELVRVISPNYGAMDMVVLLEPRPVTVYVNTDEGERYLKERYPGARRFRVPEQHLRLLKLDRGEGVLAELRATQGPIRDLGLNVKADEDAAIEVERYESHHVWESDLECHGIDLRQKATCRGLIRWQDGPPQPVSTACTVFRGSYAKIAPARGAGRPTASTGPRSRTR